MQAESMRDDSVPFPGAWVLHCIYSEWDDDVSFPSFMLGMGGVFLFALVQFTAIPVVFFCLGQTSRPYSPAMQLFGFALLVAPAIAGLSLTTLLPMIRNGNLTVRTLTTIAFGIALLVFATTTGEWFLVNHGFGTYSHHQPLWLCCYYSSLAYEHSVS